MKPKWPSGAKQDIPRLGSRDHPAAKMKRESATDSVSPRQERLCSVHLHSVLRLSLCALPLSIVSSSFSPRRPVFLPPASRSLYHDTSAWTSSRSSVPLSTPPHVFASCLHCRRAGCQQLRWYYRGTTLIYPNLFVYCTPCPDEAQLLEGVGILDGVASRIYVLKEVSYWPPGR